MSNARSCTLKIRSSCIRVSEKESRICFGVIEDTPPCVCLRRNIIYTTGEADADNIAESLEKNQENSNSQVWKS
jgi:hypothetical protein